MGAGTATAPTLDAWQSSPAGTSASRTSARSRLWEMRGAWWWAREEPGWWKPLPLPQLVGDAGRRAIFYRVDRSSELRLGRSDGGRR